MKILKALAAIAAISLLSTSVASAAFISGNIIFAGTATFDGAAPSSSTAVTSWSSTTVLGADGDFTGVGPAATFTAPWSFNSGALPALWSVGGFTFDLTSSSIVSQITGVVVAGNGMVSGNGYDPTPGTWNFSSQDVGVNGNFSFSASSAVPDAGSTVALLGLGLIGLGATSRRFKK